MSLDDAWTSLEPDDPRPASQRIASLLRAAILTRRLVPGERLPSQNELSQRYCVARETIKSALRILREDRLIVTRRGSGTYVRSHNERPVGLRPHIEAAFLRPHVSIDFAGFSGETLHGALQEPLDKIRAGRLTPESLALRILLPDLSAPAVIPSRSPNRDDDPSVRARADHIAHRHTEAVLDSIGELRELGLIPAAAVEVRRHGTAALFKLYILNGVEAFFGFYPVADHAVTIDGQPTTIFDVLGKDVPLFHFAMGDDTDAIGDQYVTQARTWFDSVWTTIAREPA